MFSALVLILLVPCLAAADTACHSADISCPVGQECCTLDGKPSCCDAAGQLPNRSVLLSAASGNASVQNAFEGCTLWNCPGTCCNSGYMGCCPIKSATCCTNNKCCDMMSKCCGGGCCGFMSRCCGSWCCKSSQRCGLSYMTCYNAAPAGLAPAALVTLVAAWASLYFAKML